MSTKIENNRTSQEDVMNEVEECCETTFEASADCVKNNPVSAAAVVVGLGVITGIGVAAFLCGGEVRQRSMIRKMSDQISDNVSKMIPNALGAYYPNR